MFLQEETQRKNIFPALKHLNIDMKFSQMA